MEYELNELTKEQLLNKDFIPEIFRNYEDENERKEVITEVFKVAKDKGILTKIKKNVQKCENEYKIEQKNEIYNILVLGQNDKPEPTIDNYYNVMCSDDFILKHIKFNLLSNKFEYWNNGHSREWRDKDDAWLLSYIEKEYDFYNLQKYELAKNKMEDLVSYHPIKEIIEKEPWDKKHRIDRFLTDIMKCEDDEYSRELSRMIFYGGINRLYCPGCKFDYMPILMGEQGCVDCDTEYFNGTEWKKISEYTRGEKVLQYTPNGKAELVVPLNYIKQQTKGLWLFKTQYGINQCLSDNHNVYYITSKGNLYHKPFKEIRENHKIHPFTGRFITAFDYSGSGIDLSDDEIRLMIAVFADGSFYTKLPNNPTCRFHLKKDRKKQQLLDICERLGLEVTQKTSATEGYTDFYIVPPFRSKHFPKEWYQCNKHQFEVIADEVMKWDGYYSKNNYYCTSCKEDADFIQFVFNSLGKYASITIDNRLGKKHDLNGKDYEYKSIYYNVRWSKEYLKSLNHSKEKRTKFEKYDSKDGLEYCFTVPSGILILRRENCVFITGNCGKSSIVDWLNIKTDFYREVLTIDGSKGIETITGGWICEFAELLAMIRAKEVESLKGYITRTNDTFRPAYGRNILSFPRQCIFIGTTNDFQFLVDKTGNRRYLPIEIHIKKGELFKHEKYVRNYILQCWREAKELMESGETYLVIPNKYNDIIEEHQSMATDDDPKVGVIADYLNNKEVGDKICGQEIFVNCCNGLKRNYSTRDGREISIILRRFPEWKRKNNAIDFEEYGRQKYWEKVSFDKIEHYDGEIEVKEE